MPDGGTIAPVVRVDDAAWRDAVDDAETACARAAAAAFAAAPDGARVAGEVSILLADDAVLADLNRRYRGTDAPTNVLAFAALEGGRTPATGGAVLLGDIAIARETVVREAAAASKTAVEHLSHMVVHGMLHLLGFDHQAPAEAERMEELEVRALATLGIADPYHDDNEAAAPADQGK